MSTRRPIPELTEALGGSDLRREAFLGAIVERGIETGELRPADRAAALSLISAFTIGLTDGLSADHTEHRQALDGFLLLLRSYVANPPS